MQDDEVQETSDEAEAAAEAEAVETSEEEVAEGEEAEASDEEEAASADVVHYRVAADAVAVWTLNQVISSEDLAEHGIDPQRLLDLGSIEVVEEVALAAPEESSDEESTEESSDSSEEGAEA